MHKQYIRFVVGINSDHEDDLTGIFTEANFLSKDDFLCQHELETLDEIFSWFNNHLSVPPWENNNWDYGVSWFRQSQNAEPIIKKMWELANLVKEYKPIRVIKSNPGKIVYEDDFQIVAIAWRDV